MLPFYKGTEFPVGTQFFLSDGRRFDVPEPPRPLSAAAWLYRVVPYNFPDRPYLLRVLIPEAAKAPQEALPAGSDWQPATVIGIRLQDKKYRLPLGYDFALAYDRNVGALHEPEHGEGADLGEPPAEGSFDAFEDDTDENVGTDLEEAEEETTHLLEKLLADTALCITLLNLQLKWLHDDRTVDMAKLAETTTLLEQMTQMKAQYEEELARQRAAAARKLILFPGQEK